MPLNLKHSFGPGDISTVAILPGAMRVLEEVKDVSISTHFDKQSIRRLGNALPIGWATGAGSIAGTLVCTQLTHGALYKVRKFAGALRVDEGEVLSETSTEEDREVTSGRQQAASILPQQLPPFHLMFVHENDRGQMSLSRLYDVTFVDHSEIKGSSNREPEETLQYQALYYEQLNLRKSLTNKQMQELFNRNAAPDDIEGQYTQDAINNVTGRGVGFFHNIQEPQLVNELEDLGSIENINDYLIDETRRRADREGGTGLDIANEGDVLLVDPEDPISRVSPVKEQSVDTVTTEDELIRQGEETDLDSDLPLDERTASEEGEDKKNPNETIGKAIQLSDENEAGGGVPGPFLVKLAPQIQKRHQVNPYWVAEVNYQSGGSTDAKDAVSSVFNKVSGNQHPLRVRELSENGDGDLIGLGDAEDGGGYGTLFDGDVYVSKWMHERNQVVKTTLDVDTEVTRTFIQLGQPFRWEEFQPVPTGTYTANVNPFMTGEVTISKDGTDPTKTYVSYVRYDVDGKADYFERSLSYSDATHITANRFGFFDTPPIAGTSDDVSQRFKADYNNQPSSPKIGMKAKNDGSFNTISYTKSEVTINHEDSGDYTDKLTVEDPGNSLTYELVLKATSGPADLHVRVYDGNTSTTPIRAKFLSVSYSEAEEVVLLPGVKTEVLIGTNELAFTRDPIEYFVPSEDLHWLDGSNSVNTTTYYQGGAGNVELDFNNNDADGTVGASSFADKPLTSEDADVWEVALESTVDLHVDGSVGGDDAEVFVTQGPNAIGSFSTAEAIARKDIEESSSQ